MNKIKRIEFKNFRAYEDCSFDINTDKNIVLLYGNNGFGKTSFFDGIEWGLTGKIERYQRASKEKNEYPILKNNSIARSEEGYVDIYLSDGTYIKRKINSKPLSDYSEGILNLDSSSINEITIKEEFKDKVNFNESFNFSHLLSQELLNSFIRGTKDTERYKSIVKLLGLERYEKFNPHIKMMKENINNKLDLIRKKIDESYIKIEIEKAKLSNVDIDPSIKIEELSILLKEFDIRDINLKANNELDTISSKFQIEKVELNRRLDNLNQAIADLSYMEEHFIVKEETIRLLDEKKKLMLECDSNIKAINYFNVLDYILSNLNTYYNYVNNETEYDEIINNHEKLEKSLLTNPLFVSTSFEFQLTYIEKLSEKYRIIVETYRSESEDIKTLEKEILDIEKQVGEKFGLEKKLIKTARDFLKENLKLESCPICQNKFNLNETMKELEERLMAEYSPLLKDLINKIEERSKLVYEKKVGTKEMKSKLEELISMNKISISNCKINGDLKVKEVNDQKKIAYEVLSKIKLYNIKLDKNYIENEYEKTDRLIKSKSINKESQYHQLLKEELNKNIISLESEIKKYSDIKKKYNKSTIKEIEGCIIEEKKQQSIVINEVNRYSKIIMIANELIQYTKGKSVEENIVKLEKEKDILEKEIGVLSNFYNGYDTILKSVRKVIEGETQNTLNSYIETIRKMYAYLNPHLYLKSFDIKIDDTNPLNNRLVFEVFNDKDRKVNPSYIFSAAQNNVLALSIFMSFAFFQNWSNLNFVCLDDPIQNMDDINIFNFVDIIRALIKETDKQIYISTHDDRVYNFMIKKFRGNIQAFKFNKYGEAIESKL